GCGAGHRRRFPERHIDSADHRTKAAGKRSSADQHHCPAGNRYCVIRRKREHRIARRHLLLGEDVRIQRGTCGFHESSKWRHYYFRCCRFFSPGVGCARCISARRPKWSSSRVLESKLRRGVDRSHLESGSRSRPRRILRLSAGARCGYGSREGERQAGDRASLPRHRHSAGHYLPLLGFSHRRARQREQKVRRDTGTSSTIVAKWIVFYSYRSASTVSNCAARVAGTVPKMMPTPEATRMAIMAESPETGILYSVKKRTEKGTESPISVPRNPPVKEMKTASVRN